MRVSGRKAAKKSPAVIIDPHNVESLLRRDLARASNDERRIGAHFCDRKVELLVEPRPFMKVLEVALLSFEVPV